MPMNGGGPRDERGGEWLTDRGVRPEGYFFLAVVCLLFQLFHEFCLGTVFEVGPAALAEAFVFSWALASASSREMVPASGRTAPFVEFEKVVELRLPSRSEKPVLPAGLVFGIVEEHDHDAVEFVDFGLVQVVLGDGDVGLEDFAAFPGREAHVGLGAVARAAMISGGGFARGGEVELVLNGLEENRCRGFAGMIVGGEGEDFLDPQVDASFAGADVADAFEELVEVIRGAGAGRVFEPFVVHGESFEEVFEKGGGGPLAELGAAGAADAVADGEDRGEGVVFDSRATPAQAFGSNYPEFPDSCRGSSSPSS